LLRLEKILPLAVLLVVALVGTSMSLPAAAQGNHRAGAAAQAVVGTPLIVAGAAGLMPQRVAAANVRRAAPRSAVRRSAARTAGRSKATDQLGLKSTVALVVDQDTSQVLFSKNSEAVLPIASLTKLMTALVVMEAGLPLDEPLEITSEDTNYEGLGRSRLRVGTRLTREEMLHLALMSSENRAAHALGRNFPGGLSAFVDAMNRKAQQLGMGDTRYVEPTGLSSDNRSSAHDLATLARAIYEYPLLRELSISTGYQVPVGRRQVRFRNTNALVNSPSWDIGLQKTGYISAAGRCLMMQASLAGRNLIMVFLDSAGRYTRIGDAQRVRRWLESQPAVAVPAAAQPAVLEAPADEPVLELELETVDPEADLLAPILQPMS
jgi:serine-type D-Ala-D-Ala endopeptidase (penicillin-binding protein 7)